MKNVIETKDIDFRIWALDARGCWLPIFEVRATPQQFNSYRMPWLLRIEDLKHDGSSGGVKQMLW